MEAPETCSPLQKQQTTRDSLLYVNVYMLYSWENHGCATLNCKQTVRVQDEKIDDSCHQSSGKFGEGGHCRNTLEMRRYEIWGKVEPHVSDKGRSTTLPDY